MLPAPSLFELGLSLSVVTNDLSPSHFSTPPTSGAFLAPHYLLLCHAQGLDVLPLFSPPAPQPYALVRRVSFKTVVVMEQRGVLVAIAGRRDGVRVYALEEVKRAVEWRIDVEIRREKERSRRDMVKKIALGTLDGSELRELSDRPPRKASLSTQPSSDVSRGALNRKDSSSSVPSSVPKGPPGTAPVPLIPRQPTLKRRPTKTKAHPALPVPAHPHPGERPPSYHADAAKPDASTTAPPIPTPAGALSPIAGPSFSRTRTSSVSNVLGASLNGRGFATTFPDPDAKPEWDQSSDDEAINVVAAAASGSQALDERTSAQAPPATQPTVSPARPVASEVSLVPRVSARRNRPANLELGSLANGQIPPPEPSPVATLWTLRQALTNSPVEAPLSALPDTPTGEADGEEDSGDGGISLAQALLESRIPELPPAGSQRPQQAVLIASGPILPGEGSTHSPRTSESASMSRASPRSHTAPEATNAQSKSRRRRWSVMLTGSTPHLSAPEPPLSRPSTEPTNHDATTPRERPQNRLARSQSHRSNQSARTVRPAASQDTLPPGSRTQPETATIASTSSGRSRFIPKMISNAFGSKIKDEREAAARVSDSEVIKRNHTRDVTPHAPPPKLEYVKLPGTKGALMIKAVETVKKR